jgi:hypothetical protein
MLNSETWAGKKEEEGRRRRYGVQSPLGPKQSEAIFSVHLNRKIVLVV